MNAALIARYFGNKQNLFDALALHHREAMISDPLPQPPLADPCAELLRYSSVRLAQVRSSSKTLRVIVGYAYTDTSGKLALKRDPTQFHDPYLAERLRQMQQLGSLAPDVDLKALARVLVTYMGGQIMVNHLIFDRSFAVLMAETKSFLQLLRPSLTPAPKKG